MFINETICVIQAINSDADTFETTEPETEESQQNTSYKIVKHVMIKDII